MDCLSEPLLSSERTSVQPDGAVIVALSLTVTPAIRKSPARTPAGLLIVSVVAPMLPADEAALKTIADAAASAAGSQAPSVANTHANTSRDLRRRCAAIIVSSSSYPGAPVAAVVPRRITRGKAAPAAPRPHCRTLAYGCFCSLP